MIEQVRQRQRWPFIMITTILWLLATVLAAAVMWPIYQTAQFVLLVGVVSVAGATIAVLGAIYRWGGMVILGLMAAVYLVLGVPVAVPSQAIGAVLPSFAGLGTLFAATALSWNTSIWRSSARSFSPVRALNPWCSPCRAVAASWRGPVPANLVKCGPYQ
jgi:hypothetical protein